MECVLEVSACGTGGGSDGEPLACAATWAQDTAGLPLLKFEALCGEVLSPTEFFDDGDVVLYVLRALRRALNLLEYLTQSWLSKNLADERNGRFQVWLHYIPWHLILPASINRL
jgi:hypothetical protein